MGNLAFTLCSTSFIASIEVQLCHFPEEVLPNSGLLFPPCTTLYKVMYKVCISTNLSRHGDPCVVSAQPSHSGYEFWPEFCLAIIKFVFCFSILAVSNRTETCTGPEQKVNNHTSCSSSLWYMSLPTPSSHYSTQAEMGTKRVCFLFVLSIRLLFLPLGRGEHTSFITSWVSWTKAARQHPPESLQRRVTSDVNRSLCCWC